MATKKEPELTAADVSGRVRTTDARTRTGREDDLVERDLREHGAARAREAEAIEPAIPLHDERREEDAWAAARLERALRVPCPAGAPP
jgi:hypothetical protein